MRDGADVAALVEAHVRVVPDFPEPGVLFRDITPLLADGHALAAVVEHTATRFAGQVDAVAGIEARGFILAAPVAHVLGAGMVQVRKAGKLPYQTRSARYSLEYGEATVEVPRVAFDVGDRVLVVDDVLATGGTVAATAGLVREAGAEVVAVAVLMELGFLPGRAAIGDLPLTALMTV
jgi:adenine phosphoribosyltransferase